VNLRIVDVQKRLFSYLSIFDTILQLLIIHSFKLVMFNEAITKPARIVLNPREVG
jgi:hypothetical protein